VIDTQWRVDPRSYLGSTVLVSCQPVLLNRRSEHFFLTGAKHQYVKRRLTVALSANFQPLFLWCCMEYRADPNSGIENYM